MSRAATLLYYYSAHNTNYKLYTPMLREIKTFHEKLHRVDLASEVDQDKNNLLSKILLNFLGCGKSTQCLLKKFLKFLIKWDEFRWIRKVWDVLKSAVSVLCLKEWSNITSQYTGEILLLILKLKLLMKSWFKQETF